MPGTAALLAANIYLLSGTAHGAEISVMTSGAFTAAYLELIPQFERTTGNKITTAATSTQQPYVKLPSGTELLVATVARTAILIY
jgi:ABC-type molybdate transport system substrate-binding protein